MARKNLQNKSPIERQNYMSSLKYKVQDDNTARKNEGLLEGTVEPQVGEADNTKPKKANLIERFTSVPPGELFKRLIIGAVVLVATTFAMYVINSSISNSNSLGVHQVQIANHKEQIDSLYDDLELVRNEAEKVMLGIVEIETQMTHLTDEAKKYEENGNQIVGFTYQLAALQSELESLAEDMERLDAIIDNLRYQSSKE